MFRCSDIGKLSVGGLFNSSEDFDYAVRRFNQDKGKLLKFAKRNKVKIHHVCLLQAREKERVLRENKGKKGTERIKPKLLCSGV